MCIIVVLFVCVFISDEESTIIQYIVVYVWLLANIGIIERNFVTWRLFEEKKRLLTIPFWLDVDLVRSFCCGSLVRWIGSSVGCFRSLQHRAAQHCLAPHAFAGAPLAHTRVTPRRLPAHSAARAATYLHTAAPHCRARTRAARRLLPAYRVLYLPRRHRTAAPFACRLPRCFFACYNPNGRRRGATPQRIARRNNISDSTPYCAA